MLPQSQPFYDELEQELITSNFVEGSKDLNDLAWMARGIRSLTHQIDMVNAYEKNEIDRITACCQQKRFGLQEKIDKLRFMARNLLKSNDYGYDGKAKKFEMPGLGVFKFSISRESIDDSGYKALPSEKQKELQAELPHLFKEKITTTIAPNRTIIKEKILEGGEIDGFILRQKEETFDFESRD